MMTRWGILWLVAGVVLTTATQLRMAGAVGPGEVMLLVWMLLAIAQILIIRRHLISPLFKAVLLFWMMGFICLALGTAIASPAGIASVEADLRHNAQALVLTSTFSLILTISFVSHHQIEKSLAYLTAFITIPLGLLFFFPAILPFVSSRYGGTRFAGWSLNPNQTALSLLFVPFFTLYLLKQSQNLAGKVWYGLLTAGSIFLGTATRSDALTFAWGIGLTGWVIFETDRVLLNRFVKHSFSSARLAIYRTLTRLFLILASLLFLTGLYYAVSSTAEDVYDDGGQGSDRVRLWKHGLIAFSHSPIFGLGPGSHSGAAGPFLGQECHNTFIDWLTNAGSVGLISYLALLVWIGWITWRQGSPILFSALIASAGFMSFHYVLRHPIYWFGVLTIAKIALLMPSHRRLSRPISALDQTIGQASLTYTPVSTKIRRSSPSQSV